MLWFLFELELWRKARLVTDYHQWWGDELRDRFDAWPCRDCDVYEGMWW